WTWTPKIWFNTYLPFVNMWTATGEEHDVGDQGAGTEDPAYDGHVVVQRTHGPIPEFNSVLKVFVDDLGGSAIKGQDYAGFGAFIPIPGGSVIKDQPLNVINDSVPEWTENTRFQIHPMPTYKITTSEVQKVEIVDNDISIEGLPEIMQVNNNDDDENGNPDLLDGVDQ